MIFREMPTIPERDWDAHTFHPLQSYAWGLIRESLGVRVVRLGAYENDILVDVYEMTLHKLPAVSYYIGYVPRSKIPNDAFLVYLKDYCKRYHIVFVKFEPEAHVDQEQVSSLLVRSSHPLFYSWTRIIDLSKSIDQLKKELDSHTRYNVGLSDRKGVIVSEENTDEGFQEFYSLYELTTKRQHFGGHTRKYHQIIWNIFRTRGVAHLLVARHGGQPLASCELWLYKETLYYTYAGSSLENRNVKAMNALLWKVIEFGKQHGATKLDLWGILPPDSSDESNPWAGFSEFKKGYGGEAVEMIGSFDLVLSPFLYKIYSFVFFLRKRLG